MCRTLIICTDRACKKAKENLIIGEYVQNFNYMHRQGFCKKAKKNLIIGEAFQSIRVAGAPLLFDLLPSIFSLIFSLFPEVDL